MNFFILEGTKMLCSTYNNVFLSNCEDLKY